MPALTPTFVMDLESRMRVIQENEHLRLTKNLWWTMLAKVFKTEFKREIVTWVLNTAQLDDMGDGGNIAFDNMTMQDHEFRHGVAGKGLKIRRQQFEDLDGNGVQLAAEWSAQIGAQNAYWPQKQTVNVLKNGEDATKFKGYDGLALFANNHPLNPKRPGVGTYSNLITGVPIDDFTNNITTDVALKNLASVFAAIASVKMPNGVDPRFLRPKAIICSPKLFPRLVQLTSAKFLAQAAASGGGSGDVEKLIAALGYGMPIMADELVGFEGDTTYFVVTEVVTGTQLGSVVYIEREAFSTRYYTGRGGGNGVDAILDRADELEWHNSGRNGMGIGHPFGVFKCKQ